MMKAPEVCTEEIQLDGCMYKHQSVFSPENTYFASISGTHAIVYDVRSGKRRLILNGDAKFCGLKWQDENTLLTISSDSTVNTWDLNAGQSLSQFSFNYNGLFLWTYNYADSVFAVAVTKEKDQVVLRLNFEDGTSSLCAKLPVKVMNRRAIFPAERFVLYCHGRDLHRLAYVDEKALNGLSSYNFRSIYPGIAPEAIAFSSVTMVNDSVFAVLTVGRIFYWHDINENGLKPAQKSFIHAHYAEPLIAVTSLLSVFCGAPNSVIDKWNAVTTGGGRYERSQVMERLDAPVEALWLSPNSMFVLVILADNSMLVLNAVSLAVVSRPSSLHWPSFYSPLSWTGLYTDIEHPDYVVANTRTGYIQWIDPTKWRTIGEADISKENSPPRDCVNMPQYNWTNVYAVCCTSSLIVTAESRRKELNKTLLKFFYRRTPGAMYDINQMGCIKVEGRIKFIRSNMEEIRHAPSEQIVREHYVVTVDEKGKIQTYFPNSYESYRWNADLKRTFDWQQTKILDCSTIRSHAMATVNAVNADADSGRVLVWDTEKANLIDFIDKIQDVRQVRWCPPHKFREFILLMSAKEMVAAYDSDSKSFLWIIMEPELNLYTNLFTIVAYGKKTAYVINYRDGAALKRMEFSSEQNQVVATGNASNIRLSGLNSKGLSLLKFEMDENSTLRDIKSFTKSTPFSALIQQARADSQPANTSQQLHRTKVLSARKLLQGSAYSLAPLTKLAPAFIQSCLIAKST